MAKTVFNNIDPAVLERIKAMRLFDDEFMTAAFSDNIELTQLLIRILLDRNDLIVTKSMSQLQKTNLFGKSVKLDIVAEDMFSHEYNIEIQRTDKGAGGQRIRYHQAMIDSHTLQKSEDYIELPRLYIIFILEHDMFKMGKPIYRVKKTLDVKDKNGVDLPFDDDCYIMYINGEYKGDNPIGKLMHDFSTTNADEMYYDELAERMRFLKQDEKGVIMVSKIVEEYGDQRAAEALQQGLQQGIQQGLQQKAEEVAIELFQTDLPPEKIAKYVKLPLEKVLELQKTITVEA